MQADREAVEVVLSAGNGLIGACDVRDVTRTVDRAGEEVRYTSGFTPTRLVPGGVHLRLHCHHHVPQVGTSLGYSRTSNCYVPGPARPYEVYTAPFD